MNLLQLKEAFAELGAARVYVKLLAPNDNSKNQVYFGPNFQALNLFPTTSLVSDDSGKFSIFKAQMPFAWIAGNGQPEIARGAKLILYPQYPEVRFSGFLSGCKGAPSALMVSREPGRILFLGVVPGRLTLGFVAGADSDLAREFLAGRSSPTIGVFTEIEISSREGGSERRTRRLLEELGRVARLGWIESKQLGTDGVLRPCNAPQCGGFTLEAELGIAKNSAPEPDFLGWELKQFAVPTFERPSSGRITLMTPEPTAGYYKDEGVEAFIRKYGAPDRRGRSDRLNFGGVHRVGVRLERTGLQMEICGYNPEKDEITDAGGSIVLLDKEGAVAASWGFAGLLSHWSKKHSSAVYVPSLVRREPTLQYRYGDRVRLGKGTDPLLFLMAMARGTVFYDPGLKLENASTEKPRSKRRNQFRIAVKDLAALYTSMETVPVADSYARGS